MGTYLTLLRKAALTFLAAAVLVSGAQAHSKQHKVKAAQVFLDAANRTDLRLPGSQPFELLAGVKLDIRGTHLHGTYLLLWESSDQWREEVSLPGYQRIKVKTASGIWLHRSLNYEIPSVVDLDNALNFGKQLREYAKSDPGKLKSRRVSGVALQCSRAHLSAFIDQDDFVHFDTPNQDFCFASGQPVLKTELFPKGTPLAPNLTSIEYSDFVPFDVKLYPHTIQLFSENDPVLTLSVKRIAPLIQPRAADFAPPSDAIFEATCENSVAPRLMRQVPPYMVGVTRGAHVILYVLIAADGTVKHAHVIFSTTPDDNAAALASVRQWRFWPKCCNGKPTPMETYVSMNF